MKHAFFTKSGLPTAFAAGALLLLSGCAAFGPQAPSGKGGLELVILHTNDTHSYLAGIDQYGSAEFGTEKSVGGYGRVAAAIRRAKAEKDNVIALDAGDQFQGTLFFSINKWPMIADMDKSMPWDAMTLGNHEYDQGCLELAKYLEEDPIPVLAANLAPEKGCPLLKAKYEPHRIFTVRGVKVGVIGMANDETDLASACAHTRFTDAAETLRREVKALEAEGVGCVIALTHFGLPRDRELARAVDGIDVIVGGHLFFHQINQTIPFFFLHLPV